MDDLRSLGKAMPRLDTLKLDSVRSVLQEIEGHEAHEEMHLDAHPEQSQHIPEPADTSMMDVVDDLPDSDEPKPISAQPQQLDAKPQTDEQDSALQPEETVSKSEHEMSLGSVLHPTQMGAHKAVDMEVNMPIPLPWHHNLPYLLSTYLQLAFNVFMVGVALWLFYIFRSDVNKRVDEQAAAIARSAAACATLYVENECRPGKIRPALQEYCAELEECMERDPEAVRRLNANAATLAEMVNSFLDPLSWKSLFLLVSAGVLLAFAANYGFGFLRARMYYGISHPPAAEPPRVSYRMTPLVVKKDNVLKH